MTNAIFTGGVNHGVICINLTSINSRKSEACWRASTEGNGFAERSTPTKAPASRENPEHVGVPRRKAEALQGGRRQQ